MATSSAAVTATKGPKLKVLPFDPHGDRLDLGKRWEKWFERFERDLKKYYKIQDLLDQDIIERVPDNQPRSWVSPPVIAPKPDSDDIRFCIDMRMANKAIQCPYTQIPTMADIVNKCQGAERFTKLDLKEAYHQLVLDEQSRNISTFYCPDGLYRCKRLNYGTKSAKDILHLEMHKTLSGIPSQKNIADDILIGGSVEEHDAALPKVLSALTSNSITVNPDKCVFDVEEVRFVGLVFNKQGIKPDPKNVKNLQDASQTTSKVELRSFLGMVGFRERFIPNFASIVHPLRQKLKENIWAWDEMCQESFTKLQASLSEFSLLHHYVIGHDTELVVDASITGLGAVLVQCASKTEAFHPVMYKSRSLKEVETRYSATEREALAVSWTCRTVTVDGRNWHGSEIHLMRTPRSQPWRRYSPTKVSQRYVNRTMARLSNQK
ncbi:Hypothetical predicted protein [Paramuricea clavata]|uniref:Uncharacterized protein n=1 Tax=Paramuricea clavata TaxID=317549 RepID=A0A7D9D587_PARCT|nr:Hypothetical predicted protein [Paramuricea clavata]